MSLSITACRRLVFIMSLLLSLCAISFTATAQQEKKQETPAKPTTGVRRPLPKPAGGSRGFERYAGRTASARLIVAAGTRGEPAEAKKYREEGEAFYKARRYNEAIEAFNHSLQLNPAQPIVHFNLGVVYGDRQQHKEAIKAYREAVRLKADYPLAYFNMGNAYSDTGEYGKAIEAFREASQLDSIAPAAHYNSGVAYIELGRQDEAIKSFKEVVRLRPEHAAAYYNLGIAYGSIGRNKEAVDAFTQALGLREKSEDEHFTQDEARFNLGLALLNLNMKKEATVQYRVLKSRNPELANELYRLIEK
jgi:tetratricopeptide (TPR) repeat protein